MVELPDFTLLGLTQVRSIVTPTAPKGDEEPRKAHSRWVLYGAWVDEPEPSLIIYGDYHKSEDYLVGLTAYCTIGFDDVPGLTSQDSADDLTELLAPWMGQLLWDFVHTGLRSLTARYPHVDFDLPITMPKIEVDRISDIGTAGDDRDVDDQFEG